ncbi:hypothetical protein roselon_01532 [Roseibacterium elongatum DSM 19469]|uniref:Uncharacterized protein n=1 Tax=Roseicyclus elongatus DSM 19469 TaxID=1294273 RepID=W8RRZ9_9RHOB|nr:hypothetical protein [Roseibacterium elongatum]AHM03914.1 hypothetical protein roselon_01532 [Roseibacterium elongatum DSM 19469]
MIRTAYLALVTALAVALSGLAAAPAVAQQFLGQYTAYIGGQDLYNSNGLRLTEHWQILRRIGRMCIASAFRSPGMNGTPGSATTTPVAGWNS